MHIAALIALAVAVGLLAYWYQRTRI